MRTPTASAHRPSESSSSPSAAVAKCSAGRPLVLPASESARARELLETLLREFPERRAPLEQLIALERSAANMTRVGELQRALFALAHDPAERLRLALEACTLQLDEAGEVAAAEYWCEQANELAPESAAVQKLRLRVHRRTANTPRVLEALTHK